MEVNFNYAVILWQHGISHFLKRILSLTTIKESRKLGQQFSNMMTFKYGELFLPRLLIYINQHNY